MKSTHSVLYIPSVFRRQKAQKVQKTPDTRQPIDLEHGWWKIPLLFLLMLSLTGLDFVPALLIAIIMMMRYYRTDKYMCLAMMIVFFGGFALFDHTNIKIWPTDIALVASAVLWLTFKRTPLLNRTLCVIVVYAAALLFLATFSIESMTIQLLTIRNCLVVSFIIIPIVIMRKERFDIEMFFRRLLPFVLLMSIFYITDAILLSGNVLVPRTHAGYETSTLLDLYWAPGSFFWYRKYPQGMFIVSLMLYGAARVFKLRLWQWIVIILGVISTQTFTFIAAVSLVYFFLKVKPVRILKYGVLFCVLGVSIYFIDGMLPARSLSEEHSESTLRVKSTVDQFVALFSVVDDEDLAQFASGRLGQALPKLELVAKEHKQLTGLGFLHKDKSKIKQYIIINEYYSDLSNNEEVATGVEIVPVQAYISAGWIGVLVITVFFFTLYFMERRMRYSTYLLSVLCFDFIAGLGGFLGFQNVEGLIMIATAYAVVYLAQKSIDEESRDKHLHKHKELNVE